MFRDGRSSPEPPPSLRQDYQTWKVDQRKNGSLSARQSSTNGLELSIDLPSQPYGLQATLQSFCYALTLRSQPLRRSPA